MLILTISIAIYTIDRFRGPSSIAFGPLYPNHDFSSRVLENTGFSYHAMFCTFKTCWLASCKTSQRVFFFDSLLGMFLMFTGLYFVLWGKGKEEISTGDNDNKNLESESDVEKPLLS